MYCCACIVYVIPIINNSSATFCRHTTVVEIQYTILISYIICIVLYVGNYTCLLSLVLVIYWGWVGFRNGFGTGNLLGSTVFNHRTSEFQCNGKWLYNSTSRRVRHDLEMHVGGTGRRRVAHLRQPYTCKLSVVARQWNALL